MASAGKDPEPLTAQAAVLVPLVTPLRLTRKVKGVEAELPSRRAALSGVIARLVSSLRIVPLAVAAGSIVAPRGLLRVTLKPSSSSVALSPRTLTVIVRLVSFGPKETVPVGSPAATKSAASAGLVPLPLTAQLTLLLPLSTPVRLMVNRNVVVLPLAPSNLSASVAAIERLVSSLRIVPLALRAEGSS